MRVFDTSLPIDAVLEDLTASLRVRSNAVLVAAPGAGKTTRVPLVLLGEPWVNGGKLIVLEPRRLAARAAAARMAQTLGEAVGETVGLRVRLGSKISRRTRIEVVTEGVFARMILDDPSLDGVAAVLFDEFHERSLDADLGLALALDAQGGLREDLRLLVMSATLDGARVAKLLSGAPVVESEGRAYPVETRYLGRDPNKRIEEQVADAVTRALRAEGGSLLVFLPGQGEIRRVETLLRERIGDPAVDIAPLYGALERGEQDLAVSPAKPGRRKVVLATSIAETSLTIEGVRVVIDSGLARVPVYEPNIGLTRLETVRVSRAAADQRRGRAGRTEPGICYRLWEEAATGALEPFGRPEILSADLAPLLLDCAAWGVTDPTSLAFLDPPPASALKEARTLLQQLGALDGEGRITDMGRRLRDLPLPPRLARMILAAGESGQAREAADLAAVLVERGLGGDAVDLADRVERFRRDRSGRAQDMRRMAQGWAKGGESASVGEPHSIGALLTLAYPDRVAKARGKTGEYLMA
ncbi:MAG TPA: ATP-dependent helicase HrpB, partial [Microvirga sp.]|nr:ATP-dependent helicase HrpB [Microvirga sp.]